MIERKAEDMPLGTPRVDDRLYEVLLLGERKKRVVQGKSQWIRIVKLWAGDRGVFMMLDLGEAQWLC